MDKSSSSGKVSVQLSEDQISALQAILSQSGTGHSLIDLFASLPKKPHELCTINNNGGNNSSSVSSHQNNDNSSVKGYSDHSKEMDHRFVPIATPSASSYFNQMQTAINSRPDINNNNNNNNNNGQQQQLNSNQSAPSSASIINNNANNNISIPHYPSSNNQVDMKAFMQLAATNRSLFQGLPSSMYAAAVPAVNARTSNTQRAQQMDQESLMNNGMNNGNNDVPAVSLVNRPVSMAGGLLDRMAGSKHPRTSDRLMSYNSIPDRDRDRHSLFADPNAAGTTEYLANTAYDAYSRRAKESAPPMIYPGYMTAYEPSAKRARTAENIYAAPAMYPYSPAYVMPPPSAYGPYMGPSYRGVDMDDMDGYEEEEMIVMRGNAPTIFADTKLSQLLTTTDPVPYHIFIVRIAKQYTIPKREARALPTEEREKLLTVPVRFMGSPTTEFFIVAKDLCQLLHIRKGNVAKSIRNVPARDRARMRVVCPKPNGKKGTHVLSVLTVHGLKHLLQSIRSSAASSVLTVLMGQIERLMTGTQILYSMATIHGEQHGRGGEQFTVVYQHTNCEHFLKAAKSSKRNSDTESEQESTISNNNNNNTDSITSTAIPSDSSSSNNSGVQRDAPRNTGYRNTPSYSSYTPMSSTSYSSNSNAIMPASSYKPITTPAISSHSY